MFFNTPIASLPNTSPITIRRLKSIGINTFWDLLNYFPSRYENFSLISPINQVQPGEMVTVQGKITETKFRITRNGLKMQTFKLTDQTGTVELIFYNQPYLLSLLKKGMLISTAGEIKWFGQKLVIEPKVYEIITLKKLIHTGRIVPIYSEKRGLSSKIIREKIFRLIDQVDHDRDQSRIKELLPAEIISFNNLMDESEAYQQIHFPDNLDLANKARERLSFDELFNLQLANNLIKKQWQKEKVKNRFTVGNGRDRYLQQFIANLPFKLTNDQNKVVKEIITDLKKITPMNRFLQGDVGSGKTVVAAIACLLTYLNDYQSLFMAPTEILANQHYQTIKSLFEKLETNLKIKLPKIGLQTGSKKISSISDFDIIIGTHALLNKKLKFEKVGLVVIDEQHRFGVKQRTLLKEKGINPHLLTMTATPIPRTVALTLYGELDVSYISQMPEGRLPVKTFFVQKNKRKAGYDWIKNQIRSEKIQVFVICPLIEESDHETMISVKAAVKEYQSLKTEIFNRFSVGLLHGKLTAREKNQVMADFRNKKINILVATSVVEVGIDISNATIMIIEGAERYGLAQLHQLRGRVGRGSKQSYCFLFTEKEDENIINRLKFFAKNKSGIKLAEFDLKHRGPGEIFGTKQHGFIDLKIASLTDFQLIKETKTATIYFINHYKIDNYPTLKKNIEQYQSKQITNN